MDNLTPRQQFILDGLLNGNSFNVDILHEQLGVSTRTIMREISFLNEILKKKSLTIFVNENMDIYISGKKDSIQDVKSSLNAIPVQWIFNKEQRRIAIACELLVSKESLKISYFSYKFNVVMGSISLDLDTIEKFVIRKNLCLIRKRNHGVSIEGSEWDKRNALVELLFNFKPFEYLLGFFYDKGTDETVKSLFNMIFESGTIELVKSVLKNLNLKHLKLNDVKYFNLFILILVSIKKTKNNDNIHLPENVKEKLRSMKAYEELKSLIEPLGENNINLPEDEIAYLCIYINDYKYYYDDSNESDINFQDISSEIIADVSQRIDVDITDDVQLLQDLTNHLRQTFHLLNIGLNVLNPMASEIEKHYPKLFKILFDECRLIFSRYNIKISSNEVGYITMHIGGALQRKEEISSKLKILIVCPGGISSARILESKVKSLFPDIGTIYISALHDINIEKDSREYDLILSTVSIGTGSEEIHNIIEVSPFMMKKDVEKVNGYISKIKYMDETEKKSMSALDSDEAANRKCELANTILKNFHIREVNIENFEELIDFVVEDVSEADIAAGKEVIKDLILKREAKGNLVVPNTGIALLHTRSDKMKLPFVGVYRTNKVFKMSTRGFSMEDVDTFLVLLARDKENSYILRLLGKISVSLIEEKEFVEILKSGSLSDIRNHLINIVNKEEE
ncbi:PRD domain-containing protein [Clostridium tyrobutyricum]|jgi:mannitol operon transcriptional antiterminator|uniref:Mannitol operon activator, BglG family n=1 Tax=Clostridium tyrobutyricum DIVETGP TaxID=1408889 RepID=W6N9N1_CLOTY|nr:BglG family transcription antiterminator [Clostridium tyrobutyricum]AND83794.1 PTS system mannitol transporter regulatory protein [Clostridium tyrobutyricum]ANP68552.1 transcription antiterminator BglG [Clostridium tyrobutyricum]MBV4435077.1 BglG family transcription antiterminator [Clostridium tyrobutyricum]MCH4200181.1 BglG family transcription antiterminator [Clostridium tyrobutyricum]MCH4237221.1 BglG family transcription antiterminator [Clostridium tyrobutyricum]